MSKMFIILSNLFFIAALLLSLFMSATPVLAASCSSDVYTPPSPPPDGSRSFWITFKNLSDDTYAFSINGQTLPNNNGIRSSGGEIQLVLDPAALALHQGDNYGTLITVRYNPTTDRNDYPTYCDIVKITLTRTAYTASSCQMTLTAPGGKDYANVGENFRLNISKAPTDPGTYRLVYRTDETGPNQQIGTGTTISVDANGSATFDTPPFTTPTNSLRFNLVGPATLNLQNPNIIGSYPFCYSPVTSVKSSSQPPGTLPSLVTGPVDCSETVPLGTAGSIGVSVKNLQPYTSNASGSPSTTFFSEFDGQHVDQKTLSTGQVNETFKLSDQKPSTGTHPYTILKDLNGTPVCSNNLTIDASGSVIPPAGPVPAATPCTGKDCTKAGGDPCKTPTGKDNPGIGTAIGCIHTSPAVLVKDFMTFIVAISGGLAFLMMLLGAFQMLTSAGNPETLAAGKDRFTSAIIGLLFIIFAVLLMQIIGVGILNIPGFK